MKTSKPREYVSVFDNGEDLAVSTFSTLAEVLVDAMEYIDKEGQCPPKFGDNSIANAKRNPGKYVKAIQQYFSLENDQCMIVYHPDHGTIAAADLAKLVREENQRPDFEFEANMVFSTRHITKKDAELLETDACYCLAARSDCLLVYRYAEGFFVYCSDDPDTLDDQITQAEARGYSREMIELMHIARQHGCKFLHLDADGPVYDTFKKFNW